MNWFVKCQILSILCIICTVSIAAEDPDWPGWRGADQSGIYASKNWDPGALSKGIRTAWEKTVGTGYSAFSIQGNLLYTMGNKSRNDTVYCLDINTGKTVWTHTYKCIPGQYRGPKATPLVDGDRVYTVSQLGDIFSLNAKTGKVIWQKSLINDFGAQPPSWGFAGSAIIEGDTIFYNANKHGVALNKKTGKKIWSSPNGKGGYSTPILYSMDGKKAVAIFGQKAIYGINVKNGKQFWSHPWVSSYDVNAADPLVIGNRVFISSGYGKGCALLEIKKNKAKVLWQNRNIRAHFSSFIYKDGYIYGSDGNAGSSGKFVCLDINNGKIAWSQKLGMGSVLASNGYLIYFSERGKLHITEWTHKAYKEVGSWKILKGTCWTPPVLAKGKLFLRNDRGDIVAISAR